MKVTRLARTYRNLKRYRQILIVLLRYGFDDVIDRTGIGNYVKLSKKKTPKFRESGFEEVTTAERLRLVLQELGPTFVKLGQILSTRPDLIPDSYIHEFQKLQDEVPPFPVEQVKALIEDQLGRPVDQLFLSFEETPMAAASIAQVHRAVNKKGEPVAIKIQRPDIGNIIETDINILFDLAGLIERYIPESELYHPVGIAQEFAKTIRKELSFIREGQNIDRFRRNFKNDDTVYVPKVYWELTTEQILTLEYIDGIKISELEKLEKVGLNKKIIANNGCQAILKQIFSHGFFHADPHPGNLFVLTGNVIAPLDFGMTGSLDDELREALGDLLFATIEKDVNKIIRVFDEIGITENSLDERGLKNDVTDFLERYYQTPLLRLDIEKIICEFTDIIRRHRIKLPADFALIGKALVTEEGVGRMLDPDFDMITMVKPYAQELMARKLDPRRQMQDYAYTLDDFSRLLKIFPSDFKSIITKIKKGELNIGFEHHGLEHFISELDKSSNRLCFSIVIAAFIIGSSLIIQLGKGPTMFGLSVLGILGYFIAAILGLWLGVIIIRSGKL